MFEHTLTDGWPWDQGIDIEPFILAKMKYNENRPYKHGKIY